MTTKEIFFQKAVHALKAYKNVGELHDENLWNKAQEACQNYASVAGISYDTAFDIIAEMLY